MSVEMFMVYEKTIFQILQKSKLRKTDISLGVESSFKECSTLMAYVYIVIILLHYVKTHII